MRGKIPIAAARDIAKKHRVPMVVVFAIHPDRENFTIASYGETKALCKLAAGYGKHIAEGVLKAAVDLQVEPQGLPEVPAIMTPAAGGGA